MRRSKPEYDLGHCCSFHKSGQTDRAGVVCFTSGLCGLYREAGANAMIRRSGF